MSVRKRKWTKQDGTEKQAWVVDYVDQDGIRRLKTFQTQTAAKNWDAKTSVELGKGTHVADGASITVAEAGQNWIEQAELDKRRASTLTQYRQHLQLHINPHLGGTKLCDLRGRDIKQWQKDLAKSGMSEAMQAKVRTSLGSILAQAVEDDYVASNVVRDSGRRKKRKAPKPKLEIGKDIPTLDEIRALLNTAQGRFRPFLVTAIATGMRASELRGLRWVDVDFDSAAIHVRQRADRYGVIDMPKSDAGTRTIPIIPLAVNSLREWLSKCPKSELGLVFPSVAGTVQDHTNIVRQQLQPLMIAAGVVVASNATGSDGEQVESPKYTGLHALRHFYASWLINRKEDGGQGLPPKVVQERMGHATITLTMDTYGHLFPRGDDAKELQEAERALLGVA